MESDPELDTLMDVIAERNRTALRKARSGEVPVGRFWFIQEPDESTTMVDDRVFVPAVESDGSYIRCHQDHVACWKALKERLAVQAGDYLDAFAPDDWPRGRVVFNTVKKEFEVFLDKQLQTPQFQKQVLARFHLAPDEISFAIDLNYTARFTLGPDGPLPREF